MYSLVLMGPGQGRLEEDDNMDISLGGFRVGASVSLENTTWLLFTLLGETGGSHMAPKPWPAVNHQRLGGASGSRASMGKHPPSVG